MDALCFTSSVNIRVTHPFLSGSLGNNACATITSKPVTITTPHASALPPPGIPSGQDPMEGTPLRSYVPRPIETYENRSFASDIPRTWEGQITTIGTTDLEVVTKESLEAAREVQVDPTSTSAFLEYSDMLRQERQEALEGLARRSSVPVEGRATCGEEEGRGFISNFDTRYLNGVKCVEYWGVPNGPVPRLFGGPSA